MVHHAAAAKSLQSCPTLCDPIDGSPPGSPVPGILQARTRVGCHFLLQCMKGKSESEVAQSCPTLSDPVDCSLPGSSSHRILQARVLEWVASAFSVHGTTNWLKIGKGVCQCCILSPCLFNLYAEYIPRRQWHPTPALLPGKSHGRRSLVGCSPRGR